MPRWQLRYALACCAITGWSIAYALAGWGQWPRLFYDPLAHRWWIGERAGGPLPIDYFGLCLWGASGAALAAAIAWIAARAWRRPLPRVVLALLGGWALTAVAYAGSYFTWTIWPF